MFENDIDKKKKCSYSIDTANREGGNKRMSQAEQALMEAIGEGYRIVIINHAEYNILFFDEDKVIFVSKQYIEFVLNLS